MSSVTLNMTNGTPPYQISVKKTGEGYERFRGLTNNTIIFEPATDGVLAIYNVEITDSNNCTNTGQFPLVCGTPQVYPFADFEVVQPSCMDFGLVPGYIRFFNVSNATRYKICYDNSDFVCPCTETDGVINSSGETIVPIFPPTVGTSETTVIRIFNGSGCTLIKDFVFTMTTPTCQAACQISLTFGTPVC
jgi:hypothetical protein